MDQSNLSIYSASAGSGKTFTIAYEYISMMLKAAVGTADSYRNILAVTFTNKACDEMKSRIVLNLFLISNFYRVSGILKSRINDIIVKIQGKTGLSENEIVTKSKIYFTQIIHDYSFFSVFTIDSFFQKIVRNLTYELGLQQNYELELNTDLIISQLVDDIMLRAETDNELNTNVASLIEDNIELGNKWSPKASIKDFISMAVASDFSGLDCNIDEYEREIDTIIKEFCVDFKQIIDKIGALIQQNGLKEEDFYKRANYSSYCRLSNLNIEKTSCASTIFENYSEDKFKENKWFTKTSPYFLLTGDFDAIASRLKELDYMRFCSAYVVKKNMNLLRLLGKATDILHENLNRDSVFLLSDVPSMLSQIINSSSDDNGNVSVMPFVFESVGTRYNNFMIDEFQDTSHKQWDIFYTMLQEALSHGYGSIVVGDIKQSIYSWRGGDWRILSRLANKDLLPDYVKTEFLDKNFRTARNIVEFNNDFFSTEYKNNLSLFGSLESSDNSFASLYDDVWQKVTKNTDSEIKVSLYSGSYNMSDEQPMVRIFKDMVAEIENLQLVHRVPPSKITVLVRKKEEASFVANAFLCIADTDRKEGVRYDVVSDEALFVASNRAVRIILAYMRYILDNKDEISLIEASYHYFLEKNNIDSSFEFNRKAMLDSFLSDLCPDDSLFEKQSFEIVEIMINRLHLNLNEKNVPFLIAFRNVVHDFSERSTDLQAFMDYWDERGFNETLKIPESQNAIRIITIHKSKGLESDYIFIPFCNWEFVAGGFGSEYLFVKDPICGGDFRIPVKSNKSLENTAMADVYNASRYGKAIESYNLLYVAFTRAKCGLYVSSYIKEGTRGGTRVSCLLTDYFSNESFDQDIVDKTQNTVLRKRGEGWKRTTKEVDSINIQIYTKGKLPQPEDIDTTGDNNFINEYPVREKPLMNIVHHLRENIDGDRSAMIKGTKYHSIFERIKTVADVAPSVAVMFDNGEIDIDTYEKLVQELCNALSMEPLSKWFSGNCKVYNEFNIIDPDSDERLKRPDRVMVFPDEVVVLDYKFGQEENLKKYADQVRDYARLMSVMKQFAGKKISAYIWYYFKNELVKVDLSGETSIINLNS